jgi:hypothetical protein
MHIRKKTQIWPLYKMSKRKKNGKYYDNGHESIFMSCHHTWIRTRNLTILYIYKYVCIYIYIAYT